MSGAPVPGLDSWAVSGGASAADAGGSGAAHTASSRRAPSHVDKCSELAAAVGNFPADLFTGMAGARGEDSTVRDLFGFPAF